VEADEATVTPVADEPVTLEPPVEVPAPAATKRHRCPGRHQRLCRPGDLTPVRRAHRNVAGTADAAQLRDPPPRAARAPSGRPTTGQQPVLLHARHAAAGSGGSRSGARHPAGGRRRRTRRWDPGCPATQPSDDAATAHAGPRADRTARARRARRSPRRSGTSRTGRSGPPHDPARRRRWLPGPERRAGRWPSRPRRSRRSRRHPGRLRPSRRAGAPRAQVQAAAPPRVRQHASADRWRRPRPPR
jgi:hypothetical protein